jgi:DNA-binding NarL/FixJ family response regulator
MRVLPGTSSSWSRAQWAGQLNKIRVILADDHPGFPEIAEHFLEPEFEVIGKVVNGQALLDETMKLKPDVVVTDISMPVLNGIEAADRLKEAGSKSRVVFLTVHRDPDFVRRCLSTGAFGYVVKSRIATDLVPAIRQALAGRIFVSSDLPNESHT